MSQRRTITGFSNPTVKFLRSLREKKHRKAAGKFLAEGLRLLTDARESGHIPEILVMAKAAASITSRVGRPDDIAAMATLLMSEEGGYITGQVISVDGGSTMRA